MKNQKEIKERFNSVDDMFGTQQADLVNYMTFETAKEFLKVDYVKKVEKRKEKWDYETDPKKEILDYLDFAYEKAEDRRGLSAGRSMLHFKTWVWLDDDKFYNEIIREIEDYYDYGIPVLDKISKHYKYKRK